MKKKINIFIKILVKISKHKKLNNFIKKKQILEKLINFKENKFLVRKVIKKNFKK
jgi:hypothetical protein